MAVDHDSAGVELVDVQLYMNLGMSNKEARCFARFLDDELPAGFGSGKLASLIQAQLNRYKRQRLNGIEQAKQMIEQFRPRDPMLPYRT